VVLGRLRPNLWTRDSQVVPNKKALITSVLVTLDSSLHCWEKRQMYSRSFIRLLPIVLEVPGVPRAHIGALEVTHKDPL
jgi:hypothetical protein